MATLRFIGVVRKGVGRFAAELTLPTRDRMSVPIRDWPEAPQPGTLNVRINSDGFPNDFLEFFDGPDVRYLDSRRFAPEAELKASDIGNNTLPPLPERPDRGSAQVWRALLRNLETGEEQQCWVLRRIGSGLVKDLELVAGENLRDSLRLYDGTPVEIDMDGTWLQK